MPSYHLPIALTVNAPFASRSTTARGFGIDSPLARNATGRICLPDSLIKGRLLEAAEELAALGLLPYDIDMLFGKPNDTGDYSPERALLQFEEFTTNRDGKGRRWRIKMDSDLGSVSAGQLQIIESPFGPGDAVEFTGAIRFAAADAAGATAIRDALDLAFRLVRTLGGERSIGFGRVASVAVGAPAPLSAAPVTLPAGATRIPAVLTIEAPFCLGVRRPDDNLFESETVIPGAVIRACVASAWFHHLGKSGLPIIGPNTDPARPELGANFSLLRFLHAFPVPVAQNPGQPLARPVTPPLSLIGCPGRSRWYADALLHDGPAFMLRWQNQEFAPAFSLDWKEKDATGTAVKADFAIFDPPVELRVRTAINPATGAAKDEQLFAMQTVVPSGYQWRFSVDASNVPDAARPVVLAQLADVLGFPIPALGKTDAPARIAAAAALDWTLPPKLSAQAAAIPPGCFAISLQTGALLCDPLKLTASSGEAELFEAYKTYFLDASGNSLVLVRFFASQRLAGGTYLQHRFHSAARRDGYLPWLLTDAGSVFLLRAEDGRAATVIDEWKRSGLPLPRWSIFDFGQSWRDCPYHPSNGFGEINVNLPVHRPLAAGEFDAL